MHAKLDRFLNQPLEFFSRDPGLHQCDGRADSRSTASNVSMIAMTLLAASSKGAQPLATLAIEQHDRFVVAQPQHANRVMCDTSTAVRFEY